MSRRKARQDAMCIIYEIDMQKSEEQEILKRFFATHDMNEADASYINEVINLIVQHKDEIDQYVEKSSGRNIEYLAKIDLAILRIAAVEILYLDYIPVKVSIDEAIELAKIYGDDMSPSFINGVLAGLLKQLCKEGEET